MGPTSRMSRWWGSRPRGSAGSFEAGGKTIALEFPRNFVAMPGRAGEQPKIDSSEVVFVGHGVVAPEYGWDDFKGLDVRGKTLIMLVGDPPVPDPHDPSKLDPAMFKGRAMTYYGRWTYKYEIAAEDGGRGRHHRPRGPDRRGIRSRSSREAGAGRTSTSHAPAPPPRRRPCRSGAGSTRRRPRALARRRARTSRRSRPRPSAATSGPVALNAKARFEIEVKTLREVQSQNVVAKLEGSDPALKNQYVVYTAHWDHLGIDPEPQGRPDLQRCGRQRLGNRRGARDRPRRSRDPTGARSARCSSSS